MNAEPSEVGLVDGCGRRIEYLRLSVTDRCDLRCSYCLPKRFHGFCEPASWLDATEIERLVRVFARLGVTRVRLTGGEPLTRRDIVDIASRVARIPGIEDLSLSTNATRLAEMAADLHRAGVTRLNVSLDTLDRDEYTRVTGRDCLHAVLAGLAAARRVEFSLIKINMVALPSLRVEDIDAMVAYCIEQGFILRLIEAMPMGDAGRDAGFLNLGVIERSLLVRFPLVPGIIPGGGPARYLRHAEDRRFTIGFITPRSQHFCETCNRVRVTVDGSLHLCLGHEDRLDLRGLIRTGADDGELETAIRSALFRKPARHQFDRAPWKTVRVMAATGG